MKQATEHSVQSAAEEEQEQQVLIARLKGQIAAKHAELAGLRAKCLQQEEDTEASRGILTEVGADQTRQQHPCKLAQESSGHDELEFGNLQDSKRRRPDWALSWHCVGCRGFTSKSSQQAAYAGRSERVMGAVAAAGQQEYHDIAI